MKVVIPAKANSTRVINKNWRPFDGKDSLVDVKITQLRKAGFKAKDIYVSSDDYRGLLQVKQRHSVQILRRSPDLCDNSASLQQLMRSTKEQMPPTGTIAWCQVTSPSFNEYVGCLEAWALHQHDHDSLCVAFPTSPYRLTPNKQTYQPTGWSFGSHHRSSQDLGPSYSMPFAFSILTEQCIRKHGYYIGAKPYWYLAKESHIDIDTVDDFFDASAVYASRKSRSPRDK